MAVHYKRRLLSCAEKDRMSNLPLDLIGSILERLPFQDVVRTSILSKNWRCRWTTMKVRKWLPGAIKSLKGLGLLTCQLSDLDQLHGTLCLLRNSPNLETLWMVRMEIVEPRIRHYDVGPASNHLEFSDCLDQTLNRLQTVVMKSLKGSRPELVFIKILLANSPSLKKLTIQPSETSDENQRLKIVMGVLLFRRASTEAEVIYLNPKP